MSRDRARDAFGGVFLVIGLVVVVTLVTLPFVGGFFTASLAGGVLVAGGMLWWHRHRTH